MSQERTTDRYNQKWDEAPRAIRWLAITVIFVIAFLAWDGLVRPTSAKWSTAGDKILASAERIQNSDDVIGTMGTLERTIVAVGDVSPPADLAEGSQALNEAVVQVLEQHSDVTNVKFNLSEGGRISNAGTSLVSGNQRLAAVTGDFRFDATPEIAISIISSLESHADVEAIRDVRLTRSDKGKIAVRLTLETWVVTEKKKRS